jgi:predicted transcriptional regulator of viral defense system
MTYTEFKNTFSSYPIISVSQLFTVGQSIQVLRNQLNRWQTKGLIIKLKEGLYILNEHDRKIHPSRIFLANAMCTPSYVSTEYALGYYDLIPEKVEDVTSVTTKNVKKFSNFFGTFNYQHLKTTLFFGLKEIEDENKLPVFIAEPEKAVLDFIYLNRSEFKNKNKDVFAESYRFQNLNLLKKKKLIEYAQKYNNKTVLNVVEKLIEFIKGYA